MRKWPKIAGRNLISFPSAEFLKKYKIIDQNACYISNPSQLAKLFTVLGFEVWYEPPTIREKRKQHEVENLDSYIAALKANIPELEKIGLEFRDGKYYFHNVVGTAKWPKIEGKRLNTFPSSALLRELGIIGQNAHHMMNGSQLAKLMEVLLGVEIATEEDYKKLFASQLEEIMPELKKMGLEFREGKYYFNNMQSAKKWPKIAGRNLISFPNGEFLRKHGILKTHQHAMTNNNQLAKLFHVLGFPIDEKLLEEIQNEK